MIALMHRDVWPYWDGERFEQIPVRVSDYVTHMVCVAAYALLIGMKGSSAQPVISNVVFIPLNIPVPGDDVEAIWNRDTVALSGQFLKNQVIPACIAVGCVKGAQ